MRKPLSAEPVMTAPTLIDENKSKVKARLFSQSPIVSAGHFSNLLLFFANRIRNRRVFDPLSLFSGCLFVTGLTIGCSSSDWLPSFSFCSSDSSKSVTNEILIPQPYRIEITGGQYRWKVRYPGFDGILSTSDDVIIGPTIHIPEDTEILFELKSTDFVYLLSLPHFHRKEIAVPGLDFSIKVHPDTIGEFALEGDDLCGDSHPEMNGRLIVESRPQFESWLRQQAVIK